tara:strand:+ start:42 stop:338 length:297 start_codon:yes stop_codon:yes gene_type:complete
MNTEWITDAELKEANEKALKIFDNFYYKAVTAEEIWTEITVNNKFFDVNCWDEGIDHGYENREGAVHCILHRVAVDEFGVRSCDGETFYKLLTIDKNI